MDRSPLIRHGAPGDDVVARLDRWNENDHHSVPPSEDGWMREDALRMLGTWAANGEGLAQYALGAMLLQSGHVRRTDDLVEARRLLDLAAAQGLDSAQYLLAHMHYHGQGGSKDIVEARRLLGLAAEQGIGQDAVNADAQYRLGTLLWKGEGGPREKEKARGLLNLAANHLNALQALGDATRGIHVDVDAKLFLNQHPELSLDAIWQPDHTLETIAADQEPLPAGTAVLLVGLTKAPQHNGKFGRVSTRSANGGRIGVELPDGTHLAVRRENLDRRENVQEQVRAP